MISTILLVGDQGITNMPHLTHMITIKAGISLLQMCRAIHGKDFNRLPRGKSKLSQRLLLGPIGFR